MKLNKTVFIVDVYSPYARNADVRKVFSYNDNLYCIREVSLTWGQPQLDPVFDELETPPSFTLYNTFEEANNYVEDLIGARL